MYDFKPFSKGRRARILIVYEEAYQFKRLKKPDRGEPYSDRWKSVVRAIQSHAELDNAEMCLFLDLINNYTRKQVRRYLLEHGSKIVRKGKRTYIRKKKV